MTTTMPAQPRQPNKPGAWCSLYTEALEALNTQTWTRYTRRDFPELPIVAFEDLVTWNYAEARRVPLTSNGRPAGEQIFFRLK